jgi:hypothetical protein
LKKTRDNDRVSQTLDALRETARGRSNTMPAIIDCVRAYATVSEMCDALRDVWGESRKCPSFRGRWLGTICLRRSADAPLPLDTSPAGN